MLVVTLLQTLNDEDIFQLISTNIFSWEIDDFHRVKLELISNRNYRNSIEHYLKIKIKRKGSSNMQPSPQVNRQSKIIFLSSRIMHFRKFH